MEFKYSTTAPGRVRATFMQPPAWPAARGGGRGERVELFPADRYRPGGLFVEDVVGEQVLRRAAAGVSGVTETDDDDILFYLRRVSVV
jgi:hypothetical protein